MSKGLEALDHIRQYSTKFSTLGYLNINTDCDEIEKELSKLDKIIKIINDFYISEKTDYICRLFLQEIIEVL